MIFVTNLAMSALMALVVEIAGWCPFLRHRPRLRHVLWLLVLAKLIPWPAIPVPVLPAQFSESRRAESEPPRIVPSDVPVTASQSVERARAVGQIRGHAQSWNRLSPFSLAANRTDAGDWRTLLLTVTAAATGLFLWRAWRQHRAASRLIDRALCGDGRILRLAREASRLMQVDPAPAIRMIGARMTPLLWMRHRLPTIVLPAELIERLDDDQIRCVLCHELAHYVRRDVWTSLFAFLTSAVYWWNPVAWWGRRELLSAQEECCDALVISKTNVSRKKYAETLLETIEFINAERPCLPVLASGFGRTFATRRRFEMIAESQISRRLFGLGAPLVVLIGLAFLCIPVQGQATKEPQTSVPPGKAVQKPAPPLRVDFFERSDLGAAEANAAKRPHDELNSQRATLKFNDTADVTVDPKKHCLYIGIPPYKGCENGTLRIDLEKGVTYTVRCSGEAFMSTETGEYADPYPGVFFGYQTDEEDCHAIRYAILKPGQTITFTTPTCLAAEEDVFAVAFFVQAWQHRTAPAQRGSYKLSFSRSTDATPTAPATLGLQPPVMAPQTYTFPTLPAVKGPADSKAFQEWHRQIADSQYKKLINCAACHGGRTSEALPEHFLEGPPSPKTSQ
jgi:beta-lactamase regulating signal transducer with metallopeptidase domain